MKVFIVTGEKNYGKTRYLQELTELFKIYNVKQAGFLSIGILNKEGEKDFEIQDITGHKRMHLASRNPYPGYRKMNESFYFNPEAIHLGNSLIQDAFENKTDVLILDEIGPIELREKVWYPTLVLVLNKKIPVVILSVRKGLTQEVIDKFGIRDYRVIDISETPVSITLSLIVGEMS
jgi:nucleoside-triphosphatase THEP1